MGFAEEAAQEMWGYSVGTPVLRTRKNVLKLDASKMIFLSGFHVTFGQILW
jgi:hypothetical protein